MVNNEHLRRKVADQQAKGKVDREWWEKEKARIQSNFMKELDEETGAAAATPTNTGTTKSVGPASVERGTSDEDTVLVEGGGPATSGSATGSKGGTTKKRKGKGRSGL